MTNISAVLLLRLFSKDGAVFGIYACTKYLNVSEKLVQSPPRANDVVNSMANLINHHIVAQ